MKIQVTRIVIKALTGLVLLLLIGCVTPRPVPDKGLLNFLEDGKTTKQMAFERLGQPSGTFENERILTYRIGSQEGQGYFIEAPKSPGQPGFVFNKHSLVLIFNEHGILEKHSLINVR